MATCKGDQTRLPLVIRSRLLALQEMQTLSSDYGAILPTVPPAELLGIVQTIPFTTELEREGTANRCARIEPHLRLKNKAAYLRHVAVTYHANAVLHEEKARSLRDISRRVVQPQIRLQVGTPNLCNHLSVLVLVELVSHHPVVAGELTDLVNRQ